jgi:integrase
MASASITRRRTKNGPRYVVRYRLGGRAYPIRHAGSFTRERDARTCRDFVAGELSAGRDPALALRTLTLEDRHRDRLVFPRLTDNQVRDHLYRACRNAEIASYSPHDLRHRRISLWFAEGFDPQTVKTWAGHAKASMSLDVYAHVVIDPATDEWRGFWRAAYAAGRSHGVVSVWSESDQTDLEPAPRLNSSLQET